MANGRVAFKFAAGFAVFATVFSSTASAATTAVGAVDPLVSLSVFGTSSSRAAVCAAGTAAAATAAAGAAAAAQAPAPGCVLPVMDAAPVAVQTVEPVVLAPVAPVSAGFSALPLLLGLAASAFLVAYLMSAKSDGSGDLTPVSP